MPPPISTPSPESGILPSPSDGRPALPGLLGDGEALAVSKGGFTRRGWSGLAGAGPIYMRATGTPSHGPPRPGHPPSSLQAGHSWGREGQEGRSPGQVHCISGPLAELPITCHSGPRRLLADGSLTREVRCSRGRHSLHQTSLAGVPVTLGRVYFTYSGGILLGETPCRAGARVSGPSSAVSRHRRAPLEGFRDVLYLPFDPGGVGFFQPLRF